VRKQHATRERMLAKLKAQQRALADADDRWAELARRHAQWGGADEAAADVLADVGGDAAVCCTELERRIAACAAPLLRMLRAPGADAPSRRFRACGAALLRGLALVPAAVPGEGDALRERQERAAMWRAELDQLRTAALREARDPEARKAALAAAKARKRALAAAAKADARLGGKKKKKKKKTKKKGAGKKKQGGEPSAQARRAKADKVRKKALATEAKAAAREAAKAAKLAAKQAAARENKAASVLESGDV